MRAPRWTALALVLALAAGCGGNDDDADAESTPSTSEGETTTTTVASLDADDIDASASPYCAAWADLRGAGSPELTGETEADDERRKEYYTDLLPKVEKLSEEAPEEIADAVEIALDATRQVAEDGDFAPFETAESMDAQQRLAAYAQESCAKTED